MKDGEIDDEHSADDNHHGHGHDHNDYQNNDNNNNGMKFELELKFHLSSLFLTYLGSKV